MADSQQTNVEVQCADGTFLNILLDVTMAEQLQTGQIFLIEENGQIGIQQQDGQQICLLEYANHDESTVRNIENQQNSSNEIQAVNSDNHVEENNRLRALLGLPPMNLNGPRYKLYFFYQLVHFHTLIKAAGTTEDVKS